jgi:hypothetical protein
MSDTEQERLWRPNEWLKAAGYPFSRAKLYAEVKAGRLDLHTSDGVAFISPSPSQYLARLPRGAGPAFGRGRRRKAGAR